ncbi:MAG: methyltransferase regulatory domain-containing protein, partial [Rhodobacteraceae bacterium]|nr:methyltransferase regulatory domain-containing protein [Paracoccaceae bacterium]
FDYIAAHGVWSWVSAENRSAILKFIANHLKPGGVLYLGYNSHPGWSPILPLRHLMKMAFDRATGSIEDRVKAAVAFADRARAAGAAFFTANPQAAVLLDQIKSQSPSYLAHEYFNDDWTVFDFSDVAEDLAQIDLHFAGAGQFKDNISALTYSRETLPFVASARDQIERETVSDIIHNHGFRRDLFVRSPRRLASGEKDARFDRTVFAPLVTPSDYPALSLTTDIGVFKGQTPIHMGLVEAVAAGPKTLGEIRRQGVLAGAPVNEIQNALYFLAAARALAPAPAQADLQIAQSCCRLLNEQLYDDLPRGLDIGVFAAPVIGGALQPSLMECVLLLARDDMDAKRAFDILKSRGQNFTRDGKPVPDSEALAELAQRRALFARGRLPLIRRLGIVD